MRPSVLFTLFASWLLRFHRDVSYDLQAWLRGPDWPLLAVACAGMVSFLLHWLGFRMALHQVGWHAPIFQPTTWEGRVGWRKPLVFGISIALVFASLRQALCAQELVPRHVTSHVIAWSTAMEVGIITLQAWRGVPSHFNVSTLTDATLYYAKLCGALALASGCGVVTLGVFMRPTPCTPRVQAAALRHGMLLLCVANVVGVAQVLFGHWPRVAQSQEVDLCLEVTAGVESSPCYEVHGAAVVKLAHFVPLHVTEILLLLAWAIRQAPHCGGVRLVHCAACVCWVFAAAGIAGAVMGLNIMQISKPITGMFILLACCIPGIFVVVFLAPLWKPGLALNAARDGKSVSMRRIECSR